MPTAYALGQGMYVIALGAKDDLTIAVPRPLFESNTLQFASQLMYTTQAKLLLIAGAHPEANAHANVLSASNITTLFNVVHQSTQRFYQHSALLNLQIRSHSAPSAVRPSALALQNTFTDELYQPTVRRLQYALSSLGVTTQLVQGQQATRGLELGTTPQSGYQLFTTHSEQAALWLAADFKSHFGQSQEVLKERLLAISDTLQLTSLNLAALAPSDWAPAPTALLSTLQSATAKYAQEHNLPALYNVCVKQHQTVVFKHSKPCNLLSWGWLFIFLISSLRSISPSEIGDRFPILSTCCVAGSLCIGLKRALSFSLICCWRQRL